MGREVMGGSGQTPLWHQPDPQLFSLCGLAKTDAQTTLPTAKVPANIKSIQLLREAYRSI